MTSLSEELLKYVQVQKVAAQPPPEKEVSPEIRENPVDLDFFGESSTNFQESDLMEKDISDVGEDQNNHWSDENMEDISEEEEDFDFDKEFSKQTTSKTVGSYPIDKLRYQCEHCVERFKRKIVFLLHKRDKHNEPIPDKRANWKFKCDICQRKFKGDEGRRMHMEHSHQIFTEGRKRNFSSRPLERSQICDFCGDKFLRVRDLETHVKRTHRLSKKQQRFMKKAKRNKLTSNNPSE